MGLIRLVVDIKSTKGQELEGKKITVLTGKMEENLYLGSRYIKNICVVPAQSSSAYDLLDCQKLIFDLDGIKKLNSQLSGN